jgi:hypothetical protein
MVGGFLRVDKTLQIVRIAHKLIMACVEMTTQWVICDGQFLAP